MKILVVHLLRLGDFIQGSPILSGLHSRYPGSRVDVLTFRQTQALAPLVSGVGKWWTLDREELQLGLGRADIPLTTSFEVLRAKLDEIGNENYDLVINLTQTRFAGYVCGYLPARERLGLAFDVRDQARFYSPWFRYLDERAEAADDVFNYVDIFAQACAVADQPLEWPLRATANGAREVAALGLSDAPVVVAQVFTSDVKKDWGETAWSAYVQALRRQAPSTQIVILAAPGEAALAEELARRAAIEARVAILSLDGALALLARADLLITGDTSIKHLANAAAVPVIELSLGSSDYRRTGIYKADSVIAHARLSCAPCSPRAACTQPAHLCARALKPERMAALTLARLAGDWNAIAALARDVQGEAQILRTRHLETGFWFAEDLSAREADLMLKRMIERCTWRAVLNGEHKKALAPFGSESLRLDADVARVFPAEHRQGLTARLDFLEREVLHARSEQESAMASAKRAWSTETLPLAEARLYQARLEHALTASDITLKFIRSLRGRSLENP